MDEAATRPAHENRPNSRRSGGRDDGAGAHAGYCRLHPRSFVEPMNREDAAEDSNNDPYPMVAVAIMSVVVILGVATWLRDPIQHLPYWALFALKGAGCVAVLTIFLAVITVIITSDTPIYPGTSSTEPDDSEDDPVLP